VRACVCVCVCVKAALETTENTVSQHGLKVDIFDLNVIITNMQFKHVNYRTYEEKYAGLDEHNTVDKVLLFHKKKKDLM